MLKLIRFSLVLLAAPSVSFCTSEWGETSEADPKMPLTEQESKCRSEGLAVAGPNYPSDEDGCVRPQ
jgi:hypothetical protein